LGLWVLCLFGVELVHAALKGFSINLGAKR
jgi:hypothetical protein